MQSIVALFPLLLLFVADAITGPGTPANVTRFLPFPTNFFLNCKKKKKKKKIEKKKKFVVRLVTPVTEWEGGRTRRFNLRGYHGVPVSAEEGGISTAENDALLGD